MKIPSVPEIPEEEQTPTVKVLLAFLKEVIRLAHELYHENQELQTKVRMLQNEIARLKGQKGPPTIPPSKKDREVKGKAAKDAGNNRPASQRPNLKKKRSEERVIHPTDIPKGSRFKGYQDFNVEDMVLEAVTIRFRMAVYVTPEGKTVRG